MTVKELVPSVGEVFIVHEPVYSDSEDRIKVVAAVHTSPAVTVAFFIPVVESVSVARRVTMSPVFAFAWVVG